MEMFIRLLAVAVRDARRGLNRVLHEELYGLCKQIIREQSGEFALMEDWLCDCYGICNP